MHQLDLPLPAMSLSTAEVARRAGVHRDTLPRWLRAGLVPEPNRDRHGWRDFTPTEAARVAQFAKSPLASESPDELHPAGESAQIIALKHLDWDFASAKTNYLTHSIHPYP